MKGRADPLVRATAAAVDAAAEAAPGCQVSVVVSGWRGGELVLRAATTIPDGAAARGHLQAGERALGQFPPGVPASTGTVH